MGRGLSVWQDRQRYSVRLGASAIRNHAAEDNTMIHPTIGRRVWYHPDKTELETLELTQASPDQPFDAGVIWVANDRQVHLSVTDHYGQVVPRLAVRLVQPGDTIPTDGTAYCTWMPFQTQAAQAK
jgi:hypothetical protein